MDIVDKVKLLLKEEKISQRKLAVILDIPESNLSNILKRLGRKFSAEQIAVISKITKVNSDYILSVDKKIRKIPILGLVNCGKQGNDLNTEDGFALYTGDQYTKNAVAYIAVGDNMAPDVDEGSEIITNPDIAPENGDLVAYEDNGEKFIKLYYKDEEADIVQLIPYTSSSSFKTKTVKVGSKELKDLKIAKVIAIHKNQINSREARLRLVGRA